MKRYHAEFAKTTLLARGVNIYNTFYRFEYGINEYHRILALQPTRIRYHEYHSARAHALAQSLICSHCSLYHHIGHHHILHF